MNRQPRTLLFASALALAVAAGSAGIMAATAPQDITDARQESQIWTTYALNPYLRAHDLKVSVNSGKATLSGMSPRTSTRNWPRRSPWASKASARSTTG